MPRSSPRSRKSEAQESQGEVRIVGGRLRGRKLPYSGDERTRPMKDRVREAVFNLLGPGVKGTWAIDLFAGTGALGIEALSRGASRATFIERHFPTAKAIKATLLALELAAATEVCAADTFIWARKLPAPAADSSPLLVFCSPPYAFYRERQADMLAMLGRLIELAPEGSQFVVECDGRFEVAKLPAALTWDVRTYSPAVVAIASKRATAE